jgi:hypothetical protein
VHPAVELHAVRPRDGLPNAHCGRRHFFDAHPQSERELVANLGGQWLDHGEHELLNVRLERHDRVLHRHFRRDQRADRIGRREELTGRRWRQVHRLSQERREHCLVDARDLEQVRDEVPAVDHLTSKGLLDLTHGRDLTLNDEGAQGHGARRTCPGYNFPLARSTREKRLYA